MRASLAIKVGRVATVKTTGILVAAIILVLLFIETRSDFANGILFFMQIIENIHFIICMILLFGLTYFFGGEAGKEIIIENKPVFLVALKYTTVIIAVLMSYKTVLAMYYNPAGSDSDSLPSLIRKRLLIAHLWAALFLYLPMLAAWLPACIKIRQAGRQNADIR